MLRLASRLATCAILCAGLTTASSGQALRDDFSRGTDRPEGWTLRDGAGAWERLGQGKRAVSVTGTGDDVSYWARAVPRLRPNSAYAFRFRAKASPGASQFTVIAGLDACNRDFASSAGWTNYSFVFTTPANVSEAFLRLGQWHLKGSVSFSNMALLPAIPVYRTIGNLMLGEGESIRASQYEFRAPLSGLGSNSSRCLVEHTAPFNSNRWVFTGGKHVVYRHSLHGIKQSGATVTVNVNYHTGGELVASASGDGHAWTEIGRSSAPGARTFQLPNETLRGDSVYVRLAGASTTDPAGNSAPGAFQVDSYAYRASLAGHPSDATGETTFVQVQTETPGFAVAVQDLGDLGRGGGGTMTLKVTADRSLAGEIGAVLAVRSQTRPQEERFSAAGRARAGVATTLAIPYRVRGTGDVQCSLRVGRLGPQTRSDLFAATIDAYLPAYYATDYGHSLTPVPDGELWWCEAPYKVPPHRLPPPQEHAAGLDDIEAARGAGAITLSAARREREHAQLVFRPDEDPGPISVGLGDLIGSGGKKIAASALEIREAAYLRVTQPTDRTGVADEWPDPLPPLEGAWKPRAGRNNVLWLTVTVPPNAGAGTYTGALTLSAARWKREIAMKLRVRDFALPERTALRSGFGVQPGNIARYHNLKSPAQIAQVWDLYMEAFRKRRIAPLNAMALAPYVIEVTGLVWSGGTRDAARPGSGRFSLRIEDRDPHADAHAQYTKRVAVTPGKRYLLSWKCRTEAAGQPYLVTVGHFDASRTWMYGRNNDIPMVGTGEWKEESVEITERVPAEARFVNLSLRPTVWTETGDRTGLAWFDDVSLTEIGGPPGRNLVEDGGFETQPELDVQMDFAEFDKAAARYLDGMGFNAFTVNIQGLPGGRYPNFDRGSFYGYGPDTPEFDALMSRYGKKLEDHLAARGWLDKAYVYWYDEPEEKDYPIVKEGAARLKRYFPKVKRMLTEQFEAPLFGSVDLWCPVTFNYDQPGAWARQKVGEEVWWYVCTGPREPYCTLFIDHPAIELRMWLWQTWQRRVQGILIWETTWWTSPQQFPDDRVQNPWDDPMAYVADVSGTWGNGDGRFFYPPNRDPNGDRQKPIMSGPIASIRWEMLGDGIEDWEYFRLLESAVARAGRAGRASAIVNAVRRLLRVPDATTSDLTHFTTDPQVILRHRAALADAIEALGK